MGELLSPWQEWKKKNAGRQRMGIVSPIDFLNPDTEYVDEETSKTRLTICEGCPNLKFTKQCGKCGCFMPAKVKLKNAHCPEALWT